MNTFDPWSLRVIVDITLIYVPVFVRLEATTWLILWQEATKEKQVYLPNIVWILDGLCEKRDPGTVNWGNYERGDNLNTVWLLFNWARFPHFLEGREASVSRHVVQSLHGFRICGLASSFQWQCAPFPSLVDISYFFFGEGSYSRTLHFWRLFGVTQNMFKVIPLCNTLSTLSIKACVLKVLLIKNETLG